MAVSVAPTVIATYTGPLAISKALHSLPHISSKFTTVLVPISPQLPFTDEYVQLYGSSIVVFSIILLIVLLVAALVACTCACCVRCNCCYGNPVVRYESPDDGDSDLVMALRQKQPWDEVKFYHDHVNADTDNYVLDDDDDNLREALGINNEERFMRRRRRRVVFCAAIVVALAVLILLGLVTFVTISTMSMAKYNVDVQVAVVDAISFIDNTKAVVSGRMMSAATAGVSAVHTALQQPLWPSAQQTQLITIGVTLTEVAGKLAKYNTEFNTTDLKSFASGVDVVGSRMAFVVWGMLGCVMISTIFMVAALFQCRNKCCIEVEPRTNFLGWSKEPCSCRSTVISIFFIVSVLLLLATALIAAASGAVALGVSDVCQNPSSWSQSLLSHGQNNFTASARLFSSYADCPPGDSVLVATLSKAAFSLTSLGDSLVAVETYCDQNNVAYRTYVNAIDLQMTVLVNAITDTVTPLRCGRLNVDIQKVFDGMCHPFVEGVSYIGFGILLSLALLVLSRPCFNVLRFYRGHELMASLYAQHRAVTRPLVNSGARHME